MKILATLSLLGCVLLSGCVVAPVGPPVAYAPGPVVVVPHAYYYGGYGYWHHWR
jgi:hypothetical protein